LTTRSIPRPLDLAAQPSPPADFWLWPNLLTLQAPFVAVLWQILLAHSLHVLLDPFASCSLALAVWLIYVTDHLIDTARPAGMLSPDPPRKAFCRRHRDKFLITAIIVGCILAAAASRLLWATTARMGWRLSVAVLSYFALIHLTPSHWRRGWPREAVVGAIFTLGTFGAVWLANGEKTLPLLASAGTFMLLCCTNCSVIETWEWQANGALAEEAPNPAAHWAAKHLAAIGIAIAFLAAAFACGSQLPGPFAAAAALSGIAFAALARYRKLIPIRFVSPLADLALCSPILVFAWSWL
jgi:hypothetical protein